MPPDASPVFPSGLQLLNTLRRHTDRIGHIAWSPDGKYLVTPSFDKTARVWETESGRLVQRLSGHVSEVSSATWSPDGKMIATASRDISVRLWDAATGELVRIDRAGHKQLIRHIAWSPDGEWLATASDDYSVLFRETRDWKRWSLTANDPITYLAWSPTMPQVAVATDNGGLFVALPQGGVRVKLIGHRYHVLSAAWLPDGERLVSASTDGTIRVWDVQSGKELHRLTEVEGYPNSVTVSADGRLMASRNINDFFRLWSTETWEVLTTIKEEIPDEILYWHSGIAFHPTDPTILATLGDNDTVVRIWKLDEVALRGMERRPPVRYRNAKIALIGETGVGKSGLALALTDQAFTATDSTHGRHVYTLDQMTVKAGDETREIHLWDLAGQPGYRLVHQLQLDAVTVAVIVFDAGGGGDPISSARYWHKALMQAKRVRGDQAFPLQIYLVAARADRGILVSRDMIRKLTQDLNLNGYYETSAKEGWGISDLKMAILNGIAWEGLPQVSSTDYFLSVKDFLASEAKKDRLLVTLEDLYDSFIAQTPGAQASPDHAAEFAANVRFAEMQGVVRLLSFGNYVLMQPEKLDAYASSIVFAARQDVDGLGSVNEQLVIEARFNLPDSERIPAAHVERLILIAAIEDMLRHEITFRDGDDLVFPSQLMREREEMRDPVGASLVFTFEGALQNIYTRLVVRLGRSGIFRQQEIWRNAVTYRAISGTCGVLFRELDSGVGEITLFYRDQANEDTRHHFEQYIETLLQRLAQPDTVRKRRIIRCTNPECGETLADRQVERRRERGLNSITCPVCDTEISLLEPQDLFTRESKISIIDRAANEGRDLDSAKTIVRGKEEVGRFDVFLSHNGKDKAQAIKLQKALRERGVLAWLDVDQLPPGGAWMKRLEDALSKCDKMAYLVGAHGKGQWQERELEVFMAENRTVIPVILSVAPADAETTISAFLKTLTWVDFRRDEPDPLEQLLWGIMRDRGSFGD